MIRQAQLYRNCIWRAIRERHEKREAGLPERGHPVQGNLGVAPDVVRHGNLVIDLAFQQAVQHPEHVGEVYAVHGGAGAGHRVQAETVLSGLLMANRLARLTSVPTPICCQAGLS